MTPAERAIKLAQLFQINGKLRVGDITAAIEAAVAEEREAIADWIMDGSNILGIQTRIDAAAAIRKRGQ